MRVARDLCREAAAPYLPGYNVNMSQIVAPHIEIRTNREGLPKAYILGTRIRVQDVYAMGEIQDKTADEIAVALPHLTLAQIYASLSYAFDHRDAVLQEMREDEDFVRQIRTRLGAGPLERRMNQPTRAGDSIPS